MQATQKHSKRNKSDNLRQSDLSNVFFIIFQQPTTQQKHKVKVKEIRLPRNVIAETSKQTNNRFNNQITIEEKTQNANRKTFPPANRVTLMHRSKNNKTKHRHDRKLKFA